MLVYTAIARKFVRKNVHRTIPKGNMGYAQYTIPDTIAVEPIFVAFFCTRRHMSMASPAILSEISLKNSELKTTHNTFLGCHMCFI